MTLPALAIKNDHWSEPNNLQPGPKTPLRIVLMDDNDFDRKHIRRIANRSKHELTLIETRSIEETRRLLTFQNVDIVLTDCRMPDGDGISFVRDLRASTIHSALSFIVVTGDDDSRTAIRALRSGAADYLPKEEITPDLFDDAISNALKVHGPVRPTQSDYSSSAKEPVRLESLRESWVEKMQILKSEILPILGMGWQIANGRALTDDDRKRLNKKVGETFKIVPGLIDDMLIDAMTELDVDLELQEVDPVAVLGELIAGNSSPFLDRFPTITIQDLPRLHARPPEIRLLFEALLSASVDACPLGCDPKVTIGSGEDPQGNAILWLRDNGLPLSVRRQALGLSIASLTESPSDRSANPYAWSICQRLIERYGGALKLSSDTNDETVVMVRFPKEMLA